MSRRMCVCVPGPNDCPMVVHITWPKVADPESIGEVVDALYRAEAKYGHAFLLEISNTDVWFFSADEALKSLSEQYKHMVETREAWDASSQG